MARTTTVKTATGDVVVKQGINASGEVTGRVNGVTYRGASWPDVERQIQAAFAVEYRWERWLVFEVEADRWPSENFGRDHESDFRFRWRVVHVSQQVTKPATVKSMGLIAGYMVLDETKYQPKLGELQPVFWSGATVEAAMRSACPPNPRCLPWTAEREAWARGMVDRLRATAAAAQAFLDRDDLALAVSTTMAIGPATTEGS